MSKKRYIAYIDGSYNNGKGGWGFNGFLNVNDSVHHICFGSCDAADSGQMEIIACTKALSNLPEILARNGIDVVTVEIRSDYKYLIDFLKGKDIYGGQDNPAIGLSKKYRSELLDLLETLRHIPYIITARKASKKDANLKETDKNAKFALSQMPIHDHFYFRENNGKNTCVPDKHRKILCSESRINTSDNTKWYERNFIVATIPTNRVEIVEEIHLKARVINLKGGLKKARKLGKVDLPIAVRLNGKGNYTLVAGISRLCIARLMNFETIPAVITEMTHRNFILTYGLEN